MLKICPYLEQIVMPCSQCTCLVKRRKGKNKLLLWIVTSVKGHSVSAFQWKPSNAPWPETSASHPIQIPRSHTRPRQKRTQTKPDQKQKLQNTSAGYVFENCSNPQFLESWWTGCMTHALASFFNFNSCVWVLWMHSLHMPSPVINYLEGDWKYSNGYFLNNFLC